MRLIDKDVKPFPSWRMIVMAVCVLTISALTINGILYAMSKQVSIVDGDKVITFETYTKTTAQVLAKKGIMLGEADEVNLPLDATLHDGDKILISRAKNIKIVNGNDSFERLTAKNTVHEVLEQFGIQISDGTEINVGLNDEVSQNMLITLVHKSEELIFEETPIPFRTIKKSTTKLKEGKTKVTNGVDGILKKTYKVCYENGEQVSKELISNEKTVMPVDKVIEYGVPNNSYSSCIVYNKGVKVSRGTEYRYKAVLTVSASAYDLSYASTGKYPGDRGYGRTATGAVAQKGVVAVDPRVIPLGSRLYIEAADGSWSYGTAVALDTGGAIKGNRIDLFVNSYNEAIAFGRRLATVYILE